MFYSVGPTCDWTWWSVMTIESSAGSYVSWNNSQVLDCSNQVSKTAVLVSCLAMFDVYYMENCLRFPTFWCPEKISIRSWPWPIQLMSIFSDVDSENCFRIHKLPDTMAISMSKLVISLPALPRLMTGSSPTSASTLIRVSTHVSGRLNACKQLVSLLQRFINVHDPASGAWATRYVLWCGSVGGSGVCRLVSSLLSISC